MTNKVVNEQQRKRKQGLLSKLDIKKDRQKARLEISRAWSTLALLGENGICVHSNHTNILRGKPRGISPLKILVKKNMNILPLFSLLSQQISLEEYCLKKLSSSWWKVYLFIIKIIRLNHHQFIDNTRPSFY